MSANGLDREDRATGARTARDACYGVFRRLAEICDHWDMLAEDVPEAVRDEFDDMCRLFIALHPATVDFEIVRL
jgi:hypothetical protein